MTATMRESHTSSRWSTTPEAASAASFHPSNAAIMTGDRRGGTSSISIIRPPYAALPAVPVWSDLPACGPIPEAGLASKTARRPTYVQRRVSMGHSATHRQLHEYFNDREFDRMTEHFGQSFLY